MNIITKDSQKLLDKFFKEHKLFFCDDVAWNINSNHPEGNLWERLSFLFSKFARPSPPNADVYPEGR